MSGIVDRTLKETWPNLLLVSLPMQLVPIALGPVLAATLVPLVTFYALCMVPNTVIRLEVPRTAGALLLKKMAVVLGLPMLRVTR